MKEIFIPLKKIDTIVNKLCKARVRIDDINFLDLFSRWHVEYFSCDRSIRFFFR